MPEYLDLPALPADIAFGLVADTKQINILRRSPQQVERRYQGIGVTGQGDWTLV